MEQIELGEPPQSMMDDSEFLGSLEQLEQQLAPVLSRSAPVHLPMDREKVETLACDVEIAEPNCQRVIRAVALSTAFVMLVLTGAALSALVFADRLMQL
jgi:hypothetical protein